MAADYTSVPEMKERLKVLSDEQNENLGRAVDAAHVAVDDYCYRTFTLAAATPRVFARNALDRWKVDVDDISSTSGLVVADTVATFTQYELSPLNGIGPNGRAGWPYTTIALATGNFAAPTNRVTATVTITAKWGWAAVPVTVRDACRILAGDLFAMNGNKFGVAGLAEMGVMRIRENVILRTLLDPYVNYRKAGLG